jgi:RNA polymerase subunit RPABC4/transcription elongation factor Spt4
MNERYCVNCKHYAPHHGIAPACLSSRNTTRDMVSGLIVPITSPAAMRDGGPCDKEGKLFEPIWPQ